MANILLLAPFVTFPSEPGANRFITIAKRLAQDHAVTLVTSRFCHFTKSHRSTLPHIEGVQVVLLDEPGYQKNVSVARYFSHKRFCQKFSAWLSHAPEFDLAYSAFPLIETNLILSRYLKNRAAPLVLDVQDLWPEAIAGPIQRLASRWGQAALTPLSTRADRAYRAADALVAVSQTYLDRADVRTLPSDRKIAVFIGSNHLHFDLSTFPSNISQPLRAVYLGTFSGSYDLETLVYASGMTKNVQIEFVGTGPYEQRLHELARNINSPAIFHGAMPYNAAMQVLRESDIALNAIKASAKQSITNKLSDYFCAGLPILSSQENCEVKALLAKGGGIHYKAGDPNDLARKLDGLAKDPEKLTAMRKINQHVARAQFLRSSSYEPIADLVNHLLKEGKLP